MTPTHSKLCVAEMTLDTMLTFAATSTTPRDAVQAVLSSSKNPTLLLGQEKLRTLHRRNSLLRKAFRRKKEVAIGAFTLNLKALRRRAKLDDELTSVAPCVVLRPILRTRTRGHSWR